MLFNKTVICGHSKRLLCADPINIKSNLSLAKKSEYLTQNLRSPLLHLRVIRRRFGFSILYSRVVCITTQVGAPHGPSIQIEYKAKVLFFGQPRVTCFRVRKNPLPNQKHLSLLWAIDMKSQCSLSRKIESGISFSELYHFCAP